MIKNGMRPIHPGEVLLEDYMKPLKLSENALAKLLNVPTSRVNGIVKGDRGVTADTALRLQTLFGSEAEGWLNLQSMYDLRVAEKTVGKQIAKDVAPLPLSA
jgi:addiction module HigA family antidote